MRWQRTMEGMTLNITRHPAYRCIPKRGLRQQKEKEKKTSLIKGHQYYLSAHNANHMSIRVKSKNYR